MEERTVAIDFDRVVHRYSSGWTGVVPQDPPVAGARRFIRWLLDHGYTPVIFSTRATESRGRIEIEHWLTKYGFPKVLVTGEKVPAIMYLDDLGFRFNGSFSEAMRFLIEYPEGTNWMDLIEGEA